MAEARRRCPGLVVLPMRMERYRAVSADLHARLRPFAKSSVVEKASCDDFYLDASSQPSQPQSSARSVSTAPVCTDRAVEPLESLRFPESPGFRESPGFPESVGLRKSPGLPQSLGFHESRGFPQSLGFHESLGLRESLGLLEPLRSQSAGVCEEPASAMGSVVASFTGQAGAGDWMSAVPGAVALECDGDCALCDMPPRMHVVSPPSYTGATPVSPLQGVFTIKSGMCLQGVYSRESDAARMHASGQSSTSHVITSLWRNWVGSH